MSEAYLELKILDLLKFKVRGSSLTTIAKRLGTSQSKLSGILEFMVEEGKLIKRGRYYRLPVVKELPVELPTTPCHRILIKYSGLKVSWGAVERLRYILESVGKLIAAESGNNARSGNRRTVGVVDVNAAASKLGINI